jgi:menaquinone-dependent protoporphyrinogen IX oxidase
MKKILVTYDTISNSTKQVASIINKEIAKLEDVYIDLKLYSDITNLSEYDIIIIGSPMRFKNFNSAIRNYIAQNKEILQNKKVIYFLTCLYLIRTTENVERDFSVFIDPSFDAVPKSFRKMNIMDKTHCDMQYIDTVLKNAINPKAIGFFKGKLDLKSLGLFSRFFMRIVTLLTKKEQVGDFLNPTSVSQWTKTLKNVF